MKELCIYHIPAADTKPAQARVTCRLEENAQPLELVTDFTFALTDDERRLIQWYLEEYLLYPWGQFRERAAQVEQLMQAKGAALFEAVFGTRRVWQLYARVADDLDGTRFVIHAHAPEGIAIPWELLRDPERGEFGLLSQQAYAFTRSQPDLLLDRAEVPGQETFNILMVISRPDGPERDVPFQSVARPLLELFRKFPGRVRLDILRPPTYEQLERVLSERPNHYHVIHFDGHGAFQKVERSKDVYGQPGEQGRLVFEGEDGKPRFVTGTELGVLLSRARVPVVLLNACQSGMTRPDSLYPSVGNQLLKAGARGVVAMAYSVFVQTAVRFMARLYQELVNGQELGRAVTQAREELRAHPQRSSAAGEVPVQDWMVPVLFQSVPVTPMRRAEGEEKVVFNAAALGDRQAQAGAEVGCPEPPAYGFVGRDGLVLTLERAFQGETVVLLRGMAGVGKTEAAVGFARWLAETNALDGPILFFSFERYLPLSQVCDRVGAVFQKSLQRQGIEWHLLAGEDRRTLALDILRQIPCLLIWDNFEPVAGFPTGTPSAWAAEEQQALRAFLADLRGGQTRVLLTSRRDEPWLGPLYKRVEVSGLALLEAQELALRVLRRAGLPEGRIRALPRYDALLKFLGGNPLAIQVIVPELARRAPDDLLRALQSGALKLSGDDPAQGRERSLAASLSYRLEALGPERQARLGALGLFQGFVNADVLAYLCGQEGAPETIRGMDRAAWLPLLDSAAEVGLLRGLGGGYYHVHPALPWFFHDLMQSAFAGQVDGLHGAFCAAYGSYYSYLSQLFHERAELARDLLSAEEPNALAALRLARRRQDWEAVKGILYGLNQLMDVEGRWTEWGRLVAELYGEVTDGGEDPLPGREGLWRALLAHQQELALYRRDFNTAEKVLLRLKGHYEQAGDAKNTAAFLQQLGRIAEERRAWDEAEGWYRQSLAIRERIHDEHGQSLTLHGLGNIAFERRAWEEAEGWYRQSLAIKERIHDEYGQAQVLHQLGMIAQERRAWEEAEGWYRQSLAIEERIHNEHGQAITLHQLGMIAQERRAWDEAEGWYRQSLAIKERIQDEHGQAQTLHQLGRIAQERRAWDEAEGWYRQSLAIKERIHNEYGQASTLHQLGMTAEEQGRMEEALAFYRQAEDIFARSNDPHNLAIVQGSIQRVTGGAPPEGAAQDPGGS